MKKYILSWALPAILLAGCTQESVTDETLDKGQDLIFETLSDKNSGTRTTIDAGGLITWSASDEIRVNGTSSSVTTLLDGGSAAQFTVSGVTGANFNALYPSTMYASYGDGKYGLNLPATQIYKDNVTFSDNANPSVAYSSSSSSGDAYKLAFYNLCGIMKVNIKAASGPISGIRYVRLTTNEDIAGSFNADCQTNVLSASTGDKYKSIDMDLGTDKSTDDNITVYFVLPPNTYSAGWKISLLDANKNTLSETNPAAEPMRIVRSKRITTNIDMANDRPSSVILINANSYTLWGVHNNATTHEEIKRIIGNGCFWDESGPAWKVGNFDVLTTGLWIRVRDIDPALMADSAVPDKATDAVRTNPNYIFLPATSILLPTGAYRHALGTVGYYWCNSWLAGGWQSSEYGPGVLYFQADLVVWQALPGTSNYRSRSVTAEGTILE